ncbi:MAG: hypothetical protein AB7T20_08300 [Steroidobacteraceae bacterium]
MPELTLETSPEPQVALSPPPQLPETLTLVPAAEEPPAPPSELTLQASPEHQAVLSPLPPLPETLSIAPAAEEPPAPPSELTLQASPEPQASLSPPTPPPVALPPLPEALASAPAAQEPPTPSPLLPLKKASSSARAAQKKPTAPSPAKTLQKSPAPQAAAFPPPRPTPSSSRRLKKASPSPSAAKALPATPASASPPAMPAAASSWPASANVIVLSADRALIDLLRDSLAGMHRVWRADDVAHAAELIVTASNAVFLVDASLAGCDARALAKQLHEQFPELAIIVAGRRDDDALFAPLVSSGVVFRCLHNPDSAESIRDLVDATQRGPRRKTDLPAAVARPALVGAIGRSLATIKLPKVTLPKIRVNRAWVRRWSGRVLRLVALLLAAWALWQWKPWLLAAELFARQEPAPAVAAVVDNDAKLLKLLDDAGTALMRDRLVDPPGRNALELYRAALALEPGNALAKHGIDNVAEKLLAEAERALEERNLPQLASAIDAARSARPDHPRLEYYSLQLKRERERIYGPGKPRAVDADANR